jgi:hypothetical protein
MGTYYAWTYDNQGINMWGIFFVPESSCSNWPDPDRPTTGCSCVNPIRNTGRRCLADG